MRPRAVASVIAAVALAAAATAVWLFPRALPIVALEQKVTRDDALTRADSFFRVHALAPAGARTAVRFQGNDSLRTYVELAGGGHDSLNALVRGRDVAPFTWLVRAFVAGNPREARVAFAPDGRIIGFSRAFAESDQRPTISADSGRQLADHVLDSWTDERLSRWRFVTSSYDTKKTSGRVDRTYTYERADRRIAGAPIRIDVGIAGDTPSRIRPYVEIPESFRRRYAEMRSANELLSLIASLGILAVAIAGIVFLQRHARDQHVRWREAAIVGSVIGALGVAAGLNEMPGSWFGYDTATSPLSFQVIIAVGAVLTGGLTGVMTALTLAAAESATRAAFPWHLDWWKLWTYRGTKEVAARVAGGYAAACIAFAYVAVFYLVTRSLFGWWVPSELLDDPNQIASPIPWISGIAISLNAGVWEEALFRALPLSLLSFWVGQRPSRRRWIAGGIVASALIFGFAHSNYASWPPYSRGVEIFLDACFWGVLFVNFGLIVTVVAHFVYDLVLFGLFAASGTATQYRISAAIIAIALLAPAIVVVVQWVRQRRLVDAPADARFAAWVPDTEEAVEMPVAPPRMHTLSARARQLAMATMVLAAILALALPARSTLGPQFSANRADVLRAADSSLRVHGANPAGWTRLTATANDTLGPWPRFVREYKLVPLATRLATTIHPPAWWTVRYVHTSGSTSARTEEWRVRVWPDGRPLDARHIIPDSARRTNAAPADVRRIALSALAREGVDTATLSEAEYKEVARPARRDVSVTYTDTAVKLPVGAAARAWVQIAGDEPLVARRGVELPESFLRADRQRQTNRTIVGGIAVLLLVGAIAVGAIFAIRRRPELVHDGVLSRRQTITVISALAALAIVDRLNSLPGALFSYDTSEPWTRFLGTTALGFASVVPVVLFAMGVWLVLGALRRRVGIPMRVAESSGATLSDTVLGGLGLGSIVFAAGAVGTLIPNTQLPRSPHTLLDLAVPALDNIATIPISAMMMVAALGIPILVVLAVSRRRPIRLLLACLMVLLIAVIVFSSRPEMISVSRVVGFFGVVVLAVIVLRPWGSLSAWSWIVAALIGRGLDGLRETVHGLTWQEHVAGAVTAAVVSGLIVWIARRPPADSRNAAEFVPVNLEPDGAVGSVG